MLLTGVSGATTGGRLCCQQREKMRPMEGGDAPRGGRWCFLRLEVMLPTTRLEVMHQAAGGMLPATQLDAPGGRR